MRITTWNINGLRAGLSKGMLEDTRRLESDILCLQEIKARPDQLGIEDVNQIEQLYPHLTWNPAQRPGYSGTASWARSQPEEVKLGLGYEEFDGEGRVVASRYPGFWLFNIYFPNGQRDLGRVPYKLDFYAKLLDLCDQLHSAGQKVILCGDFNTAHREIDLRHPRENSGATGFLPEERAWIDRYLEHGFIDVFRKLYPEKIEYTWWTYIGNARKNNTGWRLDYFLVSNPLFEKVEDVINHTNVLGSDHCPVTLVMKDQFHHIG
jgi:exodeoxyribonuclease-3